MSVRWITSLVLTKKFQIHWFKITLLGEVEIVNLVVLLVY